MTKNFSNGLHRTKARFPKVRTGCRTCKRRKLKCDEAKPTCKRCSKNDLECGGYAPPKAWIFDPNAKLRQISRLPIDHAANHTAISHHVGSSLTGEHNARKQRSVFLGRRGSNVAYADGEQALLNSQTLLPYVLSEDYHHLQHYLDIVEPSISGITPYQDFWGVIVPQVAWHDGAIRHLIAAMSISYNELIGTQEAMSQMNQRKIVERCNLAIIDWSKQLNPQNSTSSALVMSRILSLINYVGGDFELSKIHRLHGMHIARQTLADADSGLASRSLAETLLQMNLCGPGFLADEDPVVKMVDETRLRLLSKPQQTSLKLLKGIRQDFEDWLFATPRSRWLQLPCETRHAVLNTWGLMNRTIGSLFNPESTPVEAQRAFGLIFEARTKRASQVESQRTQEQDILLHVGNIDREISLKAGFQALREDIDASFFMDDVQKSIHLTEATLGVRRLTDIFLIHAADILKSEDESSFTHGNGPI